MGEIKEYKIIWSPTFKKEFEDICDYISTQLKEPIIARKIYYRILAKLNSLKYFPEVYIKMQIKDIEFRRILLKNYVIIYQIDFIYREVLILHIFHGNQDYLNLI